MLGTHDRAAERPATPEGEIAAEPQAVGLLLGERDQLRPFRPQPRDPRLGILHPGGPQPGELDPAEPMGSKPVELVANVLTPERPCEPPPARVRPRAAAEVRRRRL